MEFWFQTNWAKLFVPQMSLPEILIRGTVIYLSVVTALRLIMKRQAGKVSMSDLLVVMLVAGICRNPLIADDYSITDGVLIMLTILFWSFALDWLSYHIPFVHSLSHPKPVPLIQDGVVLKENLAGELMTQQQLISKLRLNGVNDPKVVAEAWMEGDGHVSVVRRD
jgi:uncharacterized membrane protein YcaP (DUF421 family)